MSAIDGLKRDAVATAAVVAQSAGNETMYPMFEAHDITTQGAFLAGPLFLETGEELTVEFSLDAQTQVRTRVRVTALERGDIPGMKVAFPELSETHRVLLESRAEGETKNDPTQSSD